MARSSSVALPTELSAADQAQMAEMRRADSAPHEPEPPPPAAPLEEPPVDQGQPLEESPSERPPPGYVPHGALNEERTRRQQSEERLRELERQNTLLQERTNLILQSVQQQAQQPAQPQAEIPTIDKDPVGYLVGTIQRQGEEIQRLLQDSTQRQQAQQQTQQTLSLAQLAQVKENEFKAVTPDYEPALAYLMQQRQAELQAVGIRDPMQRQQILSNEYLTVAQIALGDNRNPAEAIYEIAKVRGYKPANGAAAPQEVIPPVTAAERVANVAAGQQQSRSLSSVRGSAPVPLTAQRLIEMSPAEFDAAISTPEGRALLGV
jgi:hypothetical protein